MNQLQLEEKEKVRHKVDHYDHETESQPQKQDVMVVGVDGKKLKSLFLQFYR